MPSGLFRKDGDIWVFAGPTPAAMQQYTAIKPICWCVTMFTADAAGASRTNGPYAFGEQHQQYQRER